MIAGYMDAGGLRTGASSATPGLNVNRRGAGTAPYALGSSESNTAERLGLPDSPRPIDLADCDISVQRETGQRTLGRLLALLRMQQVHALVLGVVKREAGDAAEHCAA